MIRIHRFTSTVEAATEVAVPLTCLKN
jgi:hypothetical protein